jgi:16S rRNA (uracil1498-N3)-methyltransferase
MVEKLAELGVRVLHPVDCRRGVWHRAPARLERWRRVAVAALRQSRRAWLLDVREPASLDAALEAVPAGAERWVCDPSGGEAASEHPRRTGTSVGLVGPAAGFDPAELDLARTLGFRPIRLAEARLRAETAALAWAAWWASASCPGAKAGLPESVEGGGLDAMEGRP